MPPEAPQLELKANYGLVEPITFEFPALHAYWTPETLAAFDLTKKPKDDSVRIFSYCCSSSPSHQLYPMLWIELALCFSTCALCPSLLNRATQTLWERKDSLRV